MTPKLGQSSADTALLGKRDAHHVAAVLVTSHRPLMASDPVAFTDATHTAVAAASDLMDAVVDPFLIGITVPGQLFWVILRPELVTNLHHQFDIGEGEKVAHCSTVCLDDEPSSSARFYDDDGCSGSWCGDRG